MSADLIKAAHEARRNAYAPYSGFLVGASVRSDSGKIYAGCNVENAAYPEGTCAEAAAIAAMVGAGEQRITEVAVTGSGDSPCMPCGGCRQKLAEFCSPDVIVHVCGSDGEVQSMTVGELLPHAFGPGNFEGKS